MELKLKDGEVYGSLSFKIPTPKVKYAKENGVIAININASPIHLAVAEVSKTGELLSYQTISLHNLLGLSQNSKDHREWILAHRIVDLAIQKGKAKVVENAKNLLDNLIQSLQSASGSCEGANGRNPELASSEGSPLFPYPWKGLAKGPFSSEAIVGGRGMG